MSSASRLTAASATGSNSNSNSQQSPPPPPSSLLAAQTGSRPLSSHRSHPHQPSYPSSNHSHPLSHSHSHSHAPPPLLPPPQLNGTMHPGSGVPSSIVGSTPNTRAGEGGNVVVQQPGGQPQPGAANPQSVGVGVVGVMPGGPPPPPPGMMAPPHPSAARLNDLLEFVKAEFEQVAGEGGMLRAQKDEYEAMIHSHAAELNAMRAMAYDLERKYHDDKRVLQDENSRLQDEVTRLRQQLDSTRTALPPTASIPPLSSSATVPPSSSSRPTLPSLMGGGGPQSPSVRPASTGPSSHSVGMFGGGAAAQIGEREREYAAQQGHHNGNGRDQSVPIGDHSNKRSRMDEDDRRKPSGPQRHSSALPSYANSSVGPNRPASTGPHPPNSAPAPPPLHHPSPLPPSNGLPPLSNSAPSPAPPVSQNQSQGSSSTPAPPQQSSTSNSTATSNGSKVDEKPSIGGTSVEVTNFDPETAPKDLKKEGSDWMTMFNPNVKRVLDVGLVHTLVHDSVVCCVRFSPDGKVLATGCNRNTTLYDTKTGAKIGVLFDESSGQHNDNYIRSASFSPDGKYLATGSEDRVVRIWNLSQKRIAQVFQGHKSEIYSLAFSPDGRRLVSGSGDKTARMWDLETGACLFTLAIDDITIA
ncbi:hypothetical protein JCM5350_003650, partial [Sporobolomyces pararoseus]